MRALVAVMASAVALGGCMQTVSQIAAQDAAKKAVQCYADIRATPEGELVYKRMWRGDGTDTADKLSDAKPLTPPERDALVQVHSKSMRCQQIIIGYDDQYAAWEAQYWQAFFQRGDQIFYKLASGEMPVGVANKLIIESSGRLQVDRSKGHADAVAADEAARQRAAELLIQSGALRQPQVQQPQVQLSQTPALQAPRMTTTNCTWLGNTLNCTSM